jgi:alpha-galactosidase
MMNNYAMQIRLARYQTCGFYNDPDFLIVDWPDLSLDEKKTHFALWSSFSAPLIISAYIPDLTADEVAYLTNKDIIAVDQDALCEQATVVSQDSFFDVLTKNLAGGERLVTVMNRGDGLNRTEIGLERLGIDPDVAYTAKDLWTGKTSTVRNSITVKLRSRQTAIYRIAPAKGGKMKVTPTGQIFNTFSMNCLAATRHSSVAFTACNGADAQVWTVSTAGLVSPLSAPKKCLSVDSGEVGLEKCDRGDKSQVWKYGLNGNLVNKARGLCLEENEDGVLAKNCGKWLDSQVVALPGGVKLE